METPQYRAIQANYDGLVKAIETTVEEVARKAFTYNLISNSQLKQAENTFEIGYSRASKLLSTILTRVEVKLALYDVFMRTLKEIPVLMDIVSKVEEDAEKYESNCRTTSYAVQETSRDADSLYRATNIGKLS